MVDISESGVERYFTPGVSPKGMTRSSLADHELLLSAERTTSTKRQISLIRPFQASNNV